MGARHEDQRMSKKVCPCGVKSVPGLICGVALCQKHYNALMFGTGQDHITAVQLLNQQKGRTK